jgi:hypothetical protein
MAAIVPQLLTRRGAVMLSDALGARSAGRKPEAAPVDARG